jgi:hypothetical protein
MYSTRTSHLDVINIILKYLEGTPKKRIWLRGNNTYNTYGVIENFDRKLNMGFCIFVSGNLVT